MFNLRTIPFQSIEGFISKETCEFHHGKHHQTYVNNLNNLIKGTEFENADLFTIVTKSKGGIFNNAAQVYNHDFYWDCLSQNASEMSSELKDAICESFGSLDSFKEEYIKAATTLFGSGWCWVALNTKTNKLEIIQTSNAQTPVVDGYVPVLVVDVWEHAYYVDFRNARPGYLEKFYSHINWKFVSQAYEWAKKEGIHSVKFYMDSLHK